MLFIIVAVIVLFCCYLLSKFFFPLGFSEDQNHPRIILLLLLSLGSFQLGMSSKSGSAPWEELGELEGLPPHIWEGNP